MKRYWKQIAANYNWITIEELTLEDIQKIEEQIRQHNYPKVKTTTRIYDSKTKDAIYIYPPSS